MKLNIKQKSEILQYLKNVFVNELDKTKRKLIDEYKRIIRAVFTSKIVVNDKEEMDVFLPAFIVQNLQFYKKSNEQLVKEMERSKQAVIDMERRLNEIDGNLKFILKKFEFKQKG